MHRNTPPPPPVPLSTRPPPPPLPPRSAKPAVPLPPRSTKPAAPLPPPLPERSLKQRPPPPPVPSRTRPPPPTPPQRTLTTPQQPAQTDGHDEPALTEEQRTHFLEHGYVLIRGAFAPHRAADFSADLWPRLGYSPHDRSTWTKERTHLPPTPPSPSAPSTATGGQKGREHCKTFAPKAWRAICALLGGESRVDSENSGFISDAFIVNLGVPGSAPQDGMRSDGNPHALGDWHVDGDFFVHFLDSREQALLVVPLFSDIAPGGGGTVIACDSIAHVASHLHQRPEGVQPGFGGNGWFVRTARQCDRFCELTGEAGDVVLLHPLMLHSASRNYSRVPRVITNPRVALREPFAYGRDGSELSLVERKTLLELRVDRLDDWHITGQRRGVVPARLQKKAA